MGLEGDSEGKETGRAVVDRLRAGLEKMRRGVGDAGKLDKSWSLVWRWVWHQLEMYRNATTSVDRNFD